jgi:aminopeptidase N/puromycin-sensitive aminopeptidase
VDKIMNSLVSEAGVPFVELGTPSASSVPITQSRFFLTPKGKPDGTEKWVLPICFKTSSGEKCEIASSETHNIATPQAPYLFADAEGKGYYRTSYPDKVYSELLGHVEGDLKPEERISLIGDEWALSRAGKTTVGAYLDLVEAVDKDASPEVLGFAVGNIGAIDSRNAGRTCWAFEVVACQLRPNV